MHGFSWQGCAILILAMDHFAVSWQLGLYVVDCTLMAARFGLLGLRRVMNVLDFGMNLSRRESPTRPSADV
jgi:hypothetical protein